MGVVVNPGKDNPVLPASPLKLRDWFRESLDRIVPAAEQAGVQLIVKNHPLSFLHRADELVAFFDQYGWRSIGLAYDFANGMFGREEPYGGSTLHSEASSLGLCGRYRA
jgi:L-ribulose-5-phosphate 3-epimerase